MRGKNSLLTWTIHYMPCSPILFRSIVLTAAVHQWLYLCLDSPILNHFSQSLDARFYSHLSSLLPFLSIGLLGLGRCALLHQPFKLICHVYLSVGWIWDGVDNTSAVGLKKLFSCKFTELNMNWRMWRRCSESWSHRVGFTVKATYPFRGQILPDVRTSTFISS